MRMRFCLIYFFAFIEAIIACISAMSSSDGSSLSVHSQGNLMRSVGLFIPDLCIPSLPTCALIRLKASQRVELQAWRWRR